MIKKQSKTKMIKKKENTSCPKREKPSDKVKYQKSPQRVGLKGQFLGHFSKKPFRRQFKGAFGGDLEAI